MNAFKLLLPLLAGLVMSGCAVADHRPGPGYGYDQGYDQGYDYDYAEVLSADPVYQSVRVPDRHQVCWDQDVHYTDRGRGNPAGAVLGGLVGGVLGHQIGGGDGRTAATVVGTIAGVAVGNNVGREPPRHYSGVEERCRVDRGYREEQRLTGYRVTYLYNGQSYTTHTRRDPGRYIRVRVSVSPAE